MAQDVTITLTAKDGTTQTFRTAGQAAQKMGDQIEQAGDRGSAGLKQSERGAADLGKALGALTLVGVKLAADQERMAVGLQRNYGDAAEGFQKFADQVQNTTIFSDDQVVESANIAATLAKNYGFTADQIKQLIATSADLASLQGISLADATERTSSAMRGEAEAAEVLGLTLNDHALGLDHLSASTTDAEKAQLRFTALQQQSAYALGAAGEVADQNGQKWHAWANTAQDALQGVGGELSAFQGPILALAGASQVLGPLASGLKTAGLAAKEMQLGSAALSLATGPVGLVLAAGAAGVAIYELATRESDAEQQAHALAEATDAYTASLQSNTTALLQAGAFDTTQGTAKYLSTIIDNGKIAQDRIEALAAAQQYLVGMSSGTADDPGWMRVDSLDAYTQSMLAASDANGDFVISASEYNTAQALLHLGFEASAGDAARLTDAVASLSDEIANPDFAGGELAKAVDDIVHQVGTGVITLDEGIARLNALGSTGLDAYNLAWREHKKVIDDAAASYEHWELIRGHPNIAVIDKETAARQEQRDRMLANLEDENQAESEADNVRAIHARGEAARWKQMKQLQEETIGDRVLRERAAAAMVTAAQHDQLVAFVADVETRSAAAQAQADAMTKAYEGITGRDFDLGALAATSGQISINVALDTSDALAALENVYRVGVTNLQGIGNTVGGVQKWGDELINVEGTYGKIDDLLASQAITQGQYGAAQEAYNRIAADNVGIQENLLAIQTMQAPIIADGTDALAGQLDKLKGMAPEAQAAALGFMDAGESAKYLQIQTSLAAAAAGTMGASGEAAMQSMIEGIVATDPYMTAMLEQMGLISVGADGTVTINFDGAGESELSALNETLKQLEGTFEVLLKVDINDDGVIGYEPPPLPDAKQKVDVDDTEAVGIMLSWGRDHQPGTSKVPVEVDDATAVAKMLSWGTDHTPDPVKVPIEYTLHDLPDAPVSAKPENRTVTFAVKADTADADTKLAGVTTAATDLDALAPTVTVDADLTGWDWAYTEVTGDAADLDALTATVDLGADTTQFYTAVSALSGSKDTVDGWSATVDIDGDAQPFWDVMANAQISKDQIDGWSAVVGIDGDAQPFWDVMNNAQISKDQIDGWSASVGIGADTSLYYGAVDGVSMSVSAVDGWSATVDIGANTQPYYNNLPTVGQTLGTNYIDVVSRQVGVAVGGGPHAVGGVVTRLAEAGPEALTIPGSAMRAIAPTDGLYTVPSGTYVSPAGATDGAMQGGRRGGMAGITISGNVYITPSSPDVHDAITSQVLAQARR